MFTRDIKTAQSWLDNGYKVKQIEDTSYSSERYKGDKITIFEAGSKLTWGLLYSYKKIEE